MRASCVVTDRKAPGISEAGARSLRAFKRGFFNAPAVKAALDEKERDRLAKAGDYVKETARRSMRYRKGKSLPGTPPSAHKEGRGPLLRKHVYFAFDADRHVVVVGPAHFGRSITPRLHEHGGTRPAVQRKPKQVGQTGPIRIVSGGSKKVGRSTRVVKGDPQKRMVVYARLRNPYMAARATEIEASLYSPLDQKFPPRPFAAPALNNPKAQSFIRKLFAQPL